jgi:hypothetical protein
MNGNSLRLALALWLARTSPVVAGSTRCTTYAGKSLNRLQTLCGDGTRAISTYNRTLDRWDTTITEPSRKACMGRLNSTTRQVEVRYR